MSNETMNLLETFNPFNIRFNPANDWLGQCKSTYKGFCKFLNLQYGLRAGIILVRNYMRRYTSVSPIIYRYAPPSDGNNYVSYVKFVAERLSRAGFQPYDLSLSPDSLFALSSAIVKIECGYDLERHEFDFIVKKFNINCYA